MRHLLLVAGLFLISTNYSSIDTADARVSSAPLESALHQKKWIHGSADCRSNVDLEIEVFQYNQTSYVLRQNKCVSFEAPLIYVLFGDEKVLLLDTGATESALDFPLYETVQSLIKEQAQQGGRTERELLVIHSHSHSDHYVGDSQFEGKPNVTLVKPSGEALTRFFKFRNWPDGLAYIELGRLVKFAHENEVISLLGAHIEMTEIPGEYYPIGTTYQPNKASLTLHPDALEALNVALEKSAVIFHVRLISPYILIIYE